MRSTAKNLDTLSSESFGGVGEDKGIKGFSQEALYHWVKGRKAAGAQ